MHHQLKTDLEIVGHLVSGHQAKVHKVCNTCNLVCNTGSESTRRFSEQHTKYSLQYIV